MAPVKSSAAAASRSAARDNPTQADTRTAWPPLVAYVVSHAIYWITAARTGFDYSVAAQHARWDSDLYTWIAASGYTLARCGDEPALGKVYGEDAWCGNAGWFPLYPWLIRGLSAATGMGSNQAGWLVAEVMTLIAFFLVWQLLPVALSRSLAVLAIAVFWPASIYFHTVMPLSVAVAAMLAYVAFLKAERWALTGLAGAVACMTYPAASLVTVIGLVTVAISQHKQPGWRAKLVAVCGLPLLGVVAVFGLLQAQVGHWNAYFLVQGKYLTQDHNPWRNFSELAMRRNDVPSLEMWAYTGLVALTCLAVAVAAARRRRLDPVEAGLAAFGIAVLVASLVAGTEAGQYRAHALMLPTVIVLRHLPAWLLWPAAGILVPLAFLTGSLFFSSQLP